MKPDREKLAKKLWPYINIEGMAGCEKHGVEWDDPDQNTAPTPKERAFTYEAVDAMLAELARQGCCNADRQQSLG